MRCPFCKHHDTRVIDSRDAADNSLRRRRTCAKCKRRFTTYERIETTNLLVVKKDGAREPFNREKLRLGMMRACEKLPISSERIEQALTRVEQKLAESGKGELSSKAIGEIVMRALRQLHKVAYIRFAAVYREFADLTDFEEEVHKLLRKTKTKAPSKKKG